MEASEASTVTEGRAVERRGVRILIGIATLIVLSPVIGMVLVFAVMPALPIVLAIGLVLGPINWAEEKQEEADARWGRPQWGHAYPRRELLHGV